MNDNDFERGLAKGLEHALNQSRHKQPEEALALLMPLLTETPAEWKALNHRRTSILRATAWLAALKGNTDPLGVTILVAAAKSCAVQHGALCGPQQRIRGRLPEKRVTDRQMQNLRACVALWGNAIPHLLAIV